MSASVVDQFETAIRMACLPCQYAPPAQQVPSACTPAITFQRGTVIRLLLPRGRAPGETRGPSTAAGATNEDVATHGRFSVGAICFGRDLFCSVGAVWLFPRSLAPTSSGGALALNQP